MVHTKDSDFVRINLSFHIEQFYSYSRGSQELGRTFYTARIGLAASIKHTPLLSEQLWLNMCDSDHPLAQSLMELVNFSSLVQYICYFFTVYSSSLPNVTPQKQLKGIKVHWSSIFACRAC